MWQEPTLVSFLIVILLFATYQPLRFSIEDPERQSRYAAVFSIVAGAFVPLNFAVVRMSTEYVHPRVLNLEGGNLPGSMRLTFIVSLIGLSLLFATLMKYEMAAKTAADRDAAVAPDARRRRCLPAGAQERRAVMIATLLPLAQAPALPLHKAGPFVAAAYIVFVAVLLIYVVIMATRLTRNELELAKPASRGARERTALEDRVHEEPTVLRTRWRRRAPRNRAGAAAMSELLSDRVVVSDRARRGA